MKKFFFILVLSIGGGVLGSYIPSIVQGAVYGATLARTVITNPWTFSATTTLNANLKVTTTDAATSTIEVGCIQTYATSTATPWRSVVVASSTQMAPGYQGLMLAQYGKCPRI